ncbi:hypothetical protein HGRIS_010915 [Hohenbuehelia grisea]|uniref:Uncharacterized protein n=1 Tax=Hohenbuehelia grisea TaxID=104357 RepID=A0ABR3IYJ6_9AGAR
MSGTPPGCPDSASVNAVDELIKSIRNHAQHARWHRVSCGLLAELAALISQRTSGYALAQPSVAAQHALTADYLRFTSLLRSIDIAVGSRCRITERLKHVTEEDLSRLSNQLLEFSDGFKAKYAPGFVSGTRQNCPLEPYFPRQTLERLLDGQDRLLNLLQINQGAVSTTPGVHTLFIHPTFNDIGGNQYVTNNTHVHEVCLHVQ